VHIDDLKNPSYRKGRREPAQEGAPQPPRRRSMSDEARRAQYAAQVARAEFGRFYWSDRLHRRMERELEQSRQRRREAAELARARKRNGK
jgi:hypothetical protein